jgi:hypothetical protein
MTSDGMLWYQINLDAHFDFRIDDGPSHDIAPLKLVQRKEAIGNGSD